jgi:chromosome segregation ATPase
LGERSLNSQLVFLHGTLTTYREGRERSQAALNDAVKRVDDAVAALSLAERAWRAAKLERDSALADIAHCDQVIEDLEAEQRMIERKLTEVRVDKLAKEP